MVYLVFIAGILLLIAGAEALIRGASRLASAFGIAPLVIGLTVVAFGTSSPEFAVTVKAVLSDQASIAIGNVIGSNIFNVLLILGISAIIAPLSVSRQLVRFDVPLMIGLSIGVLLLSLDLEVGRLDGSLLFGGLIVYSLVLIRQSRRSGSTLREEVATEERSADRKETGWTRNAAAVVIGLALLVIGSRWLVDSAIAIATDMGVSDLVIGLTIIAAGTSLPEVVTSVVASARGERDIAVGNVVGSNLFNLMGVLGLAGIIAPQGITLSPAVLTFDLPVMVAVAFACLPIFFTGGEISRWEGVILLGYYGAYTTYVIFAATAHDALDTFSATMLYFVLPLTAITLGVLALRAGRFPDP
jgi:cation:H+ antiporter